MKDRYGLTHRWGSELTAEDQKACLAKFVHRFTREHVPQWAKSPRPDGTPYKPHFASDRDWLENTYFRVTKSGRLDRRAKYCHSCPTWPDGQ